MLRRTFLLWFAPASSQLGAQSRARNEYDELRDRSINFERNWNPFVRKLFGCPVVGEVSQETCKPYRAEVDIAAFEKCREAAKKLFRLRD
jgi:hypothetical protein